MNYIDIKVTVWNRLQFKDEADMKKVLGLIIDRGLDDVIDEELGFVECLTLYDTEEKITVAANGGNSTVEVYEGDQLIWENAKQEL